MYVLVHTVCKWLDVTKLSWKSPQLLRFRKYAIWVIKIVYWIHWSCSTQRFIWPNNHVQMYFYSSLYLVYTHTHLHTYTHMYTFSFFLFNKTIFCRVFPEKKDKKVTWVNQQSMYSKPLRYIHIFLFLQFYSFTLPSPSSPPPSISLAT